MTIRKESKKLPSIWRVTKIAVGIVLVGLLIFLDNYGATALRFLTELSPIDVVTLFCISLLMNWISALKWFLLLRARGADATLSRLTVVYLIGKFFNNFLPGMVGGDVARSMMIGREIGSQTQSAAAIFLERFTGFLALLFLSACALALQSSLRGRVIVNAFVVSTLALCTLVLVLMYGPVFQKRLSRLLSKIPLLGKAVPFADRLYHEVTFFTTRYRLLVQVLGLSILFYLLGGLNLFLAARAIDASVGLFDILLTTPMIYLVTIVPVSPGNIGWWEWSVALLLQPAGLMVAQGLAIGVLIRAVTLGVSLVGGLLFIVERHRSRTSSV